MGNRPPHKLIETRNLLTENDMYHGFEFTSLRQLVFIVREVFSLTAKSIGFGRIPCIVAARTCSGENPYRLFPTQIPKFFSERQKPSTGLHADLETEARFLIVRPEAQSAQHRLSSNSRPRHVRRKSFGVWGDRCHASSEAEPCAFLRQRTLLVAAFSELPES
jgi:hypothetical protein